MKVNLTVGNNYSKDEIEKAFQTNFGARIKGITLRRWTDNTPYIIIFSSAKGPYADNIKGNEFTYVGEGLRGNQKLTTANKILMNSDLDGRKVYGFVQDDKLDGWEYIGELKVIGHDYVEKSGRKVYEYQIIKVK
jgi:putative restriction endonuclease